MSLICVSNNLFSFFLHAWISDQGEVLGEGGQEQVDGHTFDLNIGA
jgi:hypothetical protein